MRTIPVLGGLLAMTTGIGGLAGCGDDDVAAGDDRPTVVVSTNIIGDLVQNLVGDDATVEVIMPPNANPHDFAPSARQASEMREAEVLVINGLGFEEGLVDTIEAAEEDGVVVVAATDAITPLELADEHDHEHEEDADGHDDESEPESDDHEDEAAEEGDHALDPHFFTDPERVREAAEYLADQLAEHVDGLRSDAFDQRVAGYLDELEELDARVDAELAPIPQARRLLITNHEVFGYFADRYDFEVIGAVIPAGSTLAEASPQDIEELAHEIEVHEIPAIFADTSSPSSLANALAAEGTDVEVVELFSESLGEQGSGAETYIQMMETNAQRIASALSD